MGNRFARPGSEAKAPDYSTLITLSKVQPHPLLRSVEVPGGQDPTLSSPFVASGVRTPAPFTALRDYAAVTEPGNPLIAEIELWVLISSTLSGIQSLLERNESHGNVTPSTLLRSPHGFWVLAERSGKTLREKVKERPRSDEQIFAAPQIQLELKRGESLRYDPWDADVYSLAVSVLHLVSPFTPAQLSANLSAEARQERLDIARKFYSAYLWKWLDEATRPDLGRRKGLSYSIKFLKLLQVDPE